MRELHKAGGTKEDVIGALQTLPVVRRERTSALQAVADWQADYAYA